MDKATNKETCLAWTYFFSGLKFVMANKGMAAGTAASLPVDPQVRGRVRKYWESYKSFESSKTVTTSPNNVTIVTISK